MWAFSFIGTTNYVIRGGGFKSSWTLRYDRILDTDLAITLVMGLQQGITRSREMQCDMVVVGLDSA